MLQNLFCAIGFTLLALLAIHFGAQDWSDGDWVGVMVFALVAGIDFWIAFDNVKGMRRGPN